MTNRAAMHHAHDPEPPVGTRLQGGSPIGDRVTFERYESGWQFAYGGDPMRPCTYELVLFWCDLRVLSGPLIAPRRPDSQVCMSDLKEAG